MSAAERPITLAVVGTGSRGQAYARWAAAHPGQARVVAVAEPRDHQRGLIETERTYTSWQELAAAGRVADAVIVATQDRAHVDPVLAFAAQGYDILLEKPIAPTEAECRQVVTAVLDAGVLFAVCHVLRYAPYTDLVTDVVASGRLGELVSVQHLEPVGWWHYAHSFVRGNWRREATSAPMLLAKSCHDLDWIAYVTGRRIRRVASFGGLQHFRREHRPAGAADRCLDCAVEPECPYSAPRLYLNVLRRSGPVWPVDIVTDTASEADLIAALRTGDYGRCVYGADNDVVDHQVVAMELDGGLTATFTMTAFTEHAPRQTRLFGTHGSLIGDGEQVTVHDFRTGTASVHHVASAGADAASGHGGGDAGVMAAFCHAVATRDPSAVRSGPRESLDSHLAVFAAERARHSGTVVTVPSVDVSL